MKVRELYSDPKKWTKGFCLDKHGNQTASWKGDAASWPLDSAINICYPDHTPRARIKGVVLRAIGVKEWIDQWNNRPKRTFEEVKELVDRLDI